MSDPFGGLALVGRPVKAKEIASEPGQGCYGRRMELPAVPKKVGGIEKNKHGATFARQPEELDNAATSDWSLACALAGSELTTGNPNRKLKGVVCSVATPREMRITTPLFFRTWARPRRACPLLKLRTFSAFSQDVAPCWRMLSARIAKLCWWECRFGLGHRAISGPLAGAG